MSVQTLRAAIAERAREIRVPALMAAGVTAHKRNWRDCPCSWCVTKRRATVVIGSQVPRTYRGYYCEDIRDAWRDEQRQLFRGELKQLENI